MRKPVSYTHLLQANQDVAQVAITYADKARYGTKDDNAEMQTTIQINGVKEKDLALKGNALIQGSYPSNAHEILVSEQFVKKYEKAIGDPITLRIGDYPKQQWQTKQQQDYRIKMCIRDRCYRHGDWKWLISIGNLNRFCNLVNSNYVAFQS